MLVQQNEMAINECDHVLNFINTYVAQNRRLLMMPQKQAITSCDDRSWRYAQIIIIGCEIDSQRSKVFDYLNAENACRC